MQRLPTCPHVKAGLSLDELFRVYRSKSAEVLMCVVHTESTFTLYLYAFIYRTVKMIHLSA